jgi:hypothetical protein
MESTLRRSLTLSKKSGLYASYGRQTSALTDEMRVTRNLMLTWGVLRRLLVSHKQCAPCVLKRPACCWHIAMPSGEYSAAVSEMNGKRGAVSYKDFEFLRQIAETHRVSAVNARLAMMDHIHEHGCAEWPTGAATG